jgi:membrane protein required for colicin V production
MQAVDIIILTFSAILVILGFRKGLIVSLAMLAGLALGIYIAFNFSDFIAVLLQKHLNVNNTWVPAISFGITFLMVLIGVLLLGKLVEKVVDLAGMSFINHLAGGLLGLLKAILILSVIFFIINRADPGHKLITAETRQKSFLYPYVEMVFPKMMSWVYKDITIPGIK